MPTGKILQRPHLAVWNNGSAREAIGAAMSSDGELLARVLGTKDFFECVVYRDNLNDWSLARDFGDFLVRIEPDDEIMGHAFLARAYRHLGDSRRAVEELQQCRVLALNRQLKPWESELFLPFLAQEEKLHSGHGG
jgi:hypothetical protein